MAYRNEVRSRAILCTYGVVVTYDLAKVRSRVRIPLGALLDGSANILFCIEEHGVSGSSPELGTIPQLAQLVEHVISPSSFMALSYSGNYVGLSRLKPQFNSA